MNCTHVVTLLGIAALATGAEGAVRVTGPGAGSMQAQNYSLTQLANGKWQIELLATPLNTEQMFEVRASAGDDIALIDNQIGVDLIRLRVIPDTGGGAVGSIDEISSSNLLGNLYIDTIDCLGDIGVVDARAIGTIVTEGSLASNGVIAARGTDPDFGAEFDRALRLRRSYSWRDSG